MQQPILDVNQGIANIAAHLRPSNPQMEGNSVLGRADCQAKGESTGFKVAILGASSDIGQSLAMLMMMNPLVSVLNIFDDKLKVGGVESDLSHMDTRAKVSSFLELIDLQPLENALTGMDLVIILVGARRVLPHQTAEDLFNINAGNVRTICEVIAKRCPNAIVNMNCNPVNSTVPLAAEAFKKAGTFDPKKLLGVTTIDVVRANKFVADVLGADPREVSIPVVGGHATGPTILPLLSQIKPPSSFTPEQVNNLTQRIQFAENEVVGSYLGDRSATLSMAYATAKFADSCLRGLNGEADIFEYSFVFSAVTELPFFASKIRLGRTGVEEVFPLGPLTEFERTGLKKAKKELAESIQSHTKGIARVAAHLHPSNSQMADGFKVALLGAVGGVGQPLALLLKMNPLASVLRLHDVLSAAGITADLNLSHIDTAAAVRTFLGEQQLENAITGMDLAYAAHKFADACLRGLKGEAGIGECSFVPSEVTELPFFVTKVRLGRTGVEEIFPLGPLNEFERIALEKAKKELATSIQKGIDFVWK
ncbi:hypothetical protein Sjap_018882 [Stephania japonica]|uniref:malate dehydrogenase n=1 Tax=Stephania japonica TaxID=461633 RepID=A0AAP0I8U1_9MAGN